MQACRPGGALSQLMGSMATEGFEMAGGGFTRVSLCFKEAPLLVFSVAVVEGCMGSGT